MNIHNNFFKTLLLIIITAITAHAQDRIAKLSFGKIDPYFLEVTYDKTSHLIFPQPIRYVDLGSDYLIASKAEDASNVLRLKAAIKDFEDETNISVITEDGSFYSFDVLYNHYPESMTYDIQTMNNEVERQNNQILFEEYGNSSPALIQLLLQTIYKENKRIVKHIASKSFGIQFSLKGLYIHNGKYYFHTELKNETNIPFEIDFINFKILDKKIAKRTVVQEKSIIPLRNYNSLVEICGTSSEREVFLLDQFTITDDKLLLIEIFEKNGGRHQTLRIENSDLVKARLISDLHVKF